MFERKVWSECKNGEGDWGETLKNTMFFTSHTPHGGVRLARFTCEDRAYGASRERPKTTVLQSSPDPIKSNTGFRDVGYHF